MDVVRGIMYNVHCTPYSVRNILYDVCILYNVQCIVYIVKRLYHDQTRYIKFITCTPYTVRRTIKTCHTCTLYVVHVRRIRTLYDEHCTTMYVYEMFYESYLIDYIHIINLYTCKMYITVWNAV